MTARAPQFNQARSLTIGAWIKGNGEPGIVVSNHFTHNDRAYNLNYRETNLFNFSVFSADNTEHALTAPLPADGQWHFVVGTYDYGTGTMTLYIDGSAAKSVQVGHFEVMRTVQPLTIGCYSNSADASILRGYFDGAISKVLLFDRSITPAEVGSIYLAR